MVPKTFVGDNLLTLRNTTEQDNVDLFGIKLIVITDLDANSPTMNVQGLIDKENSF